MAKGKRFIKRRQQSQSIRPQNKPAPNIDKVAGLANILRDVDAKQKEVVAGGPDSTQNPTLNQSRVIAALDINQEDRLFNRQANPLGDYSNITRGEDNDALEAVRAMSVQTVQSESDIDRILLGNKKYDMMANQTGLRQVEQKAFRRYKNVKRLGF